MKQADAKNVDYVKLNIFKGSDEMPFIVAVVVGTALFLLWIYLQQNT